MDIKSKYKELVIVPDEAKSAWFQSRGYQFGKILETLLANDDLDP